MGNSSKILFSLNVHENLSEKRKMDFLKVRRS